MRSDVNQSTRSLTEDCIPIRPHPPYSSRRPPLLTHLQTWGPRPRDRLESGSSGQSLRTMSLTSTGGEYLCAPRTLRPSPLEKKPIFYDYSEDFENVVEARPDYPIAPTPRRISSSLRPIIPSDVGGGSIQGSGAGAGDVAEFLRRATMIEDLQDDDYYGGEQEQPVLYSESRGGLIQHESTRTLEDSFRPPSALDEHQGTTGPSRAVESGHGTDDIAHCLTSDASTVESPLEPKTPAFDDQMIVPDLVCHDEGVMGSLGRHSHNDGSRGSSPLGETTEKQSGRSEPVTIIIPRPDLASVTSTSFPYRCSSGRKDSRFFSLSSGLADLASFVKYIDKHIDDQDSEDVDRADISVIPESKTEPSPDHGWNRSQSAREAPAPPRKSSLYQNEKNCSEAVAQNSALADELQRYKVVSTRSGPTLVPQPISPAKMLRVKNSIPRLMQALPPLPDLDPAPDTPYGPAAVPMDFEKFELSRLTDAHSTLSDAVLPQDRGEEVVERYDPFVFDHGIRKPKLKLKHAASFALGDVRRSRRGHSEQVNELLPEYPRPSTATGYPTAAFKRRLPIRVARPALTSPASDDTGTIKRRPGLNKSSTVSELASHRPLDLFSTSTNNMVAIHRAPSLQTETTTSKNVGIPPLQKHEATAAIKPQRAPPDGYACSTLLHSRLDVLSSNIGGQVVTERGMQSFFSDNSITRPRQGLRKRISNLKSKIAESRRHQCPPLGHAPQSKEVEARGPLVVAESLQAPAKESKACSLETKQPKSRRTETPKRKAKSKLGRFISSAKHRLRVWSKHKHRIDC